MHHFQIPPFISQLGTRLPTPVASAPLLILLNLAQHLKYLTPSEEFEGKVFQIKVKDFGLNPLFSCRNRRFVHASSTPADVTFYANAIDYLRLAAGLDDADTLFFQRKLGIEGDTALGTAVKYWLDATPRPDLGAILQKLGLSQHAHQHQHQHQPQTQTQATH